MGIRDFEKNCKSLAQLPLIWITPCVGDRRKTLNSFLLATQENLKREKATRTKGLCSRHMLPARPLLSLKSHMPW